MKRIAPPSSLQHLPAARHSALAAALALRGTIRQWQPDVVHAHGVKAGLLALGAVKTVTAVTT